MAVPFVVTTLLGVGCVTYLANPVKAQDGCISHPLPAEVVDKIVAAANIAITQGSGISCSSKGDNNETVDGHVMATLALLQHSLSESRIEFTASKRTCDNVSSSLSSVQSSLSATMNELAARKMEWENAVASVSSLQSSLSSIREDLDATKRQCNNVLPQVPAIHASVAALEIKFAELYKNYDIVSSKSAKCKTGWFLFQNSCYFFSLFKVNWEAGRQQCRNMGADYVKISTDAEFTFVLSLVIDNTWIGLNDLKQEETFDWISDGTVPEINKAWWHRGQPYDAGREEDCVHIWFIEGRKLLNDNSCAVPMFYICEMMPETNIS